MKKFIDEQLIKEAVGGDAEAFSEIYFALRDPVFRFAYRMLGEAAVAEEVAHDVFVFFIENPQKYRAERGSLLSFLCGVTRNRIMHHFRKTKTRLEISSEEIEYIAEPKDEIEADPLSVLLEAELSAKVETAIAKLSPLLREVILLREMQELSYQEIAEITGAEISAVKVRLHRARKILANEIAPYFNAKVEKESYEMCRS